MTEPGLRIEGLRKVVRDLEKFGVDAQDLKDAMAKIAKKGAEAASSFAPRGETGRLKNSVRGNRAKAKAVVSAGSARVPYAGAINYGWGHLASNFSTGSRVGGLRGAFPGVGFMQKADKNVAPYAIQELEHSLDALIRKYDLK